MQYIRWFKDLTIRDISFVGGKNASLGEMYSKLTKKGVPIPNGFALTSEAYFKFLKENNLDKKIKEILKNLDVKNVHALSVAGSKVRQMILSATFPKDIANEIKIAYKDLSKKSKRANVDTAVRSSATAEDLPDASFAGQQETYLNVRGEKEILIACKKCISSLFTDRAISYREAKGYDHMSIALSVGVQEMVRSDLGASGVMFTLDTESGFRGVVLINASYGLGEYVVKGQVTPDQFYVFKDGIKNGYKSIISRKLGSKEVKLVYGKIGTKQEKVLVSDQKQYCLTDDEIIQLSKWGVQIEEHYGHPMDIEWAKDGNTGKLYIVQARGETVKSQAKITAIETYILQRKGEILVEGVSVGQKIGQGKAHVITSPKQMKDFKAGEVLVTRITDPDWEPVMRIASAIVTEQGGKTSHAAIVSRELGVPCIVGAAKARQLIKNTQEITVSCAEGEVGYIYKGRLPFSVERTELKNLPQTKTKIMINAGNPDNAFALSAIPSDGIGLAREEFIFTNFIKIHPLALVHFKDIKDKQVRAKIESLTVGYKDKTQYLVDKLAEGIAFLAAAFHPHDVIVRLSDFKTNEYATLIGGKDFEPHEENPMLGWRGASRYYDPKYKPGFKLECAAIKKAREVWGLKNIIVMVPFCRTVEEGKKVLETMKEFHLERGKDGLQVYVMCEIPSNVILAKEFSQIFDGFSIGSNDLTQLTLGVDRDSSLVSHVYDENNAAVKILIRQVIQVAHQYKRKVGICGQAPSDYPEFAEFLVQEGIDSISLNPDTALKTRTRIAAMEKKLGKSKGGILKATMAAKSLLVLGVVGLTSILGGYGCQTINNQTVSDNLKASMQQQVLEMKAQLRQEITNELAKQLPTESTYSDDSFVKIKLKYPNSWQTNRWEDGVKFSNSDESEYLMVFVQKMGHPIPEEKITTTTWNNYPAKRLTDANQKDGTPYEVLEIYPLGYKKTKEIIELRGDPKTFEGSLKKIEEFTVPK
ncbi:MAG: phosphoenolpyruvate synthase [Candidatus Magasanikbacteria bacterium]